MKVKRKIVKIDEELCDGCGQCVPACAEGAMEIVDGKARVIADMYCDGLGACLGECPTGALSIVERDADEFDEEAVTELLAARETQTAAAPEAAPCGCPSTRLQSFAPASACQQANRPAVLSKAEATDSALTHWPVQIRLIPPTAPFLKGADLLVVADCVPVAFPSLHRDFLQGKVVMVGCPKFDDAQQYIQKFADIFKTAGVKSVTTLVMEVPCCAGLPVFVKKGMAAAGVSVPMEEVVIGTRGRILKRDAAN